VALERRPIETGDVQLSRLPRDAKVKSLGIEAYVCYPLLSDGRLIGTLAFGSRSRRRFAPDDLAFLRTVSRYVTVATERLGLIEQLREADRRKDEFLATLAHELRNPLAPLRHALEIQRLAEGDQATMRRTREMMDRQLTLLVRLIDDLLDVSRITQGRLELRKGTLQLEQVLQHAIEDNRPLIEARQLQVHCELPSAPVYLHADRARLAQVFFNLLNNAVKYTPPGGQIWIQTGVEPEAVAVSVRDSGIGIPPAMLRHVFELFVRVEPSSQGPGEGGLGIGLTLVKHLVELHGGTVEARSSGPGAGSEFEVRLPAAPAVLPQTASQSGSSVPGPLKRRILVADDNRESAESLKLMLELMGSEVHTAHDGQQSLALLEKLRPEVAILDIGMPRLNGYEVARRIRSQPWGHNVLLIALTGWGQESDKLRSEQAGFDHHLVKPVDPAQLEKLLQTDRRSVRLA
jgi:signal transduction histidine kinase/CheY-like chemotaxis protein